MLPFSVPKFTSEVHFSDDIIGDIRSMLPIAFAIKADTDLRTLSLERCQITDGSLMVLAGAVAASKTVRRLLLAHNTIRSAGCATLMESVAKDLPPSLEELSL